MNIGEELRKIRNNKGFTMKYLADNAGISQALVSQIERNVVDPSLKTLKAVLRVLDTELATFFLYDTSTPDVVYPQKQYTRLQVKNQDIEVLNLVDATITKKLQPLKINIPANQSFTKEDYKHTGEEYGYVLEGHGVVKLKNKLKDYQVDKGDSLYIPSHLFDKIENIGKTELVIILVATPPTM
ncbi:MAG: helix-turn-helix domain-containing protein [Candidatus Muiribacteriota bacterium]